MKNIHLWVPWFRGLVESISAGGEKYLSEIARGLPWRGTRPDAKPHAFEACDERWIDPFSFLYALAQKSTANQRRIVYPSVHEHFGLKSDLPDPEKGELFIFPTPQPRVNALFHSGTSSHFPLLWRLFRHALEGLDGVSSSDYLSALQINGVASTKLSHGLFLVNPYEFLPVDVLPVLDDTACNISLRPEHTYEEYVAVCRTVRSCFPACQPFEINHFLFLQREEKLISERSSFFHISTNVFNKKEDHWSTFQESNSVRVGGPGTKRQYPITEPDRGDIVLVRCGFAGRGIGVVLDNQYREVGGYSEEARIHVLWINKIGVQLHGQTAQDGLGSAKPESSSFSAFARTKEYKPTLGLLRGMGVPIKEDNNSNKSEIDVAASSHPLNQILYGPPGTGKTWNTVARAVAIIEGSQVATKDREEVKTAFEMHRRDGRVEVVTFHQNYAYEDFIEGIRPVVKRKSKTAGEIAYEMRHGVFRAIADRAAGDPRQAPDRQSCDVKDLIQRFLGSVESDLRSRVQIPLDVPKAKKPFFIKGVRRGDREFTGVLVGHGGHEDGNDTSLALRVLHRDYGDFVAGHIGSYQDIRPSQKGAKGPWQRFARFHYGLLKRLREYHDEERNGDATEPATQKKFVLILDEINRGNIARIFGELITLVEDSRRIGREDETKVTLPYSQEEFGVPENLYLIGTMNTADRSIALLDTALRRRFEFVEMMPDSDHPDIATDIDGVNLRRLLKAMNERIRVLRDREHQIGHTYFLQVSDLEGLRRVFQNRILPLLQEYFYDDWAKIAAVLGDNGFVKSVECPQELAGGRLVERGAKSYELLRFDKRRWRKPASYRKIYGEEPAENRGDGDTAKKTDGADEK